MKNTIETDVLFFDAETTGLNKDKLDWRTDFERFPHIVSLSWIFNGVEKDYIIKPNGWVIPLEATEVHGITTEFALEHGTDFEIVAAEFAEDVLKAPFVSAHNVYFDCSMVKANILNHCGQSFYDEYQIEDGLYKGKRIDTMMKMIKFVAAPYPNGRKGNKFPSLVELFNKLFPGETFEAHKSLADCRALKRCLPELLKLGIVKLEIRQYPGEQLTTTSDVRFENKIEFNQAPVIIPGASVDSIPEQTKEAIKPEEKPKGLAATERKPNPLLDIEDEF